MTNIEVIRTVEIGLLGAGVAWLFVELVALNKRVKALEKWGSAATKAIVGVTTVMEGEGLITVVKDEVGKEKLH